MTTGDETGDETGAPPEWSDAYEAHAVRLHRLATLLVGRDNAHDLVADAVLRAVSSRRWASIEQPGAYLAQTLINLANDQRIAATRRIGRERRVTGSAFSDELTADVDRKIVVGAALSSLSGSQVAVVYLHYWEDMTLQQVADHLGVRVGTVRAQLDRAKKRLRIALAPTSEAGDQ